MSGNPF